MLGRRQKLIETSSTIYHEGVPNVVIAPQQVATILLYESIIGSLGKKQSDGRDSSHPARTQKHFIVMLSASYEDGAICPGKQFPWCQVTFA
eukprot:scaffold3190_cov92-Cylindrotheca_fusiformis.AAC.1